MCKFEYRVEISRCEPCNVALVEQIPDEDPIYELHEKAEAMGSLSNEEIDSILYEG